MRDLTRSENACACDLQAYIFGKWRLKKSIRHSEIADKMKPCFAELGIEEEKNSGQFFYPPGGFRTWHTNVWDGLGWRGYVRADSPALDWHSMGSAAAVAGCSCWLTCCCSVCWLW